MIGKKKKVIHFICLCVATVLVLVTSMNPTVLYAASVDNNAKCLTEEYFEAYAKSDVERNVDALGNVVVQIKNEDYGIDDKLVLEKATHNIILNGQCVGYFSEEFDINQSSTKNAAASSTWKYLGTNSYKITATGAGITAAALAILAGIMGGGVAAALIGGLSGFVGTAVSGGTLTVSTWERTIGTQYYQKYRVKFTTSTGEVWGPVETIQAY